MQKDNKEYLFDLLENLNLLYNNLKNTHIYYKNEYDSILKEMAVYKTRINYDPDVKELLDILQKNEHEKAVGAYERLLSALLQDIIPGNREVLMSLNTERGVSSLNILTKKDDNPPEEPFNGNGGSVCNILSVGLRLIALVRSGKRRFMVLDESDCWIKPALIPKYASVIQEMSERMGLQVLMISHHDDKNFSCLPYRLQLNKTEMGIETEWSVESDIPHWDQEEGIRSITLSNFQSHSNTFIPLSPGITLLMGDNDIGKSSIVSALRAVFYGESSDSLIKHYEPSTKVSIDLGKGKYLFWERRFGKGSPKDPKEIYTLLDIENGYDINNPLHRTEGAKYLPEWIEEEIGIGLIEGLDVQLGHQKKPIFLLDQPGSVKAKALAIGSDNSYVQKMLKLSKEEMNYAKFSIKNAEKSLEKVNQNILLLNSISKHDDFFLAENIISYKKKINYFSNFLHKYRMIKDNWNENLNLNSIYSILDNIKPYESNLIIPDTYKFKKLFKNWTSYYRKFNILSNINDIKETLLINYNFEDTIKYKKILNNWKKISILHSEYELLNKIDKTQEAKIEIESKKLKDIYKNWEVLELKSKTYSNITKIKDSFTVEINNYSNLYVLLEKWNKNQVLEKNSKNLLNKIKKEEEDITNILSNEFKICPTCNRPWTNTHKDN